jgi:hypothetical protein
MRKIFISFGDGNFAKSLRRLKREAKVLHRFDEIRIFKPADLPAALQGSPLALFERGAGYWQWKPYIIYKTLSECAVGDVVEYTDAGCILRKESKEWAMYDKLMETHNALFFQYRDVVYPGWVVFCHDPANNRTEIGHWMKNSAIEYFKEYTRGEEFLKFRKLHACHLILKKCPETMTLVEEWLNITLFRPDLLMDPFGTDALYPYPTFNVHRHDQSILTPLVCFYQEKLNLCVLPETTETHTEDAAVLAVRFRDRKFSSFKERIKYYWQRIVFHLGLDKSH